MSILLKRNLNPFISISKKWYSSNSCIKLKTESPWYYREFISRNVANKLDATIADMFSFGKSLGNRQNGDALPSAYHLLYFNPENPEHELDFDGYESQQSPGAKYTRRLWLGGSMEFRPTHPLKIGVEAFATETLNDLKHVVNGDYDRVTVTLDRRMGHIDTQIDDNDSTVLANKVNSDWSIRETRSLVYFTEMNNKFNEIYDRMIRPPSNAIEKHKLKVTQTTLFRYSALTFNSHKIHYDKLYATNIEKLPNILVHGPLTITLLLAWMQNQIIPPNTEIKSVKYRNLLPLMVDEEITLAYKMNSDDVYRIWIENSKGCCAVDGRLYLY